MTAGLRRQCSACWHVLAVAAAADSGKQMCGGTVMLQITRVQPAAATEAGGRRGGGQPGVSKHASWLWAGQAAVQEQAESASRTLPCRQDSPGQRPSTLQHALCVARKGIPGC